MTQQLCFDLEHRPALGRNDFMIAPCNALAVRSMENWRDWPEGRCALIGSEGAGKTHLVHVWAELSGAQVVSADHLVHADIPALAQRPIAVEDVHEIARDEAAQTTLFHLFNLTGAQRAPLLLSGRAAPRYWGLSLPDLASRIASVNPVQLGAPDDALLAGVLSKLFADRQITPHADVIPYLVVRIERSFAHARAVVERLDHAALRQKRPISRPFVAQILNTM